jgi:PAS domain S-box-containing protein
MLERELFNLLEGISDAAFAVTDQGEICSWNKAAEKLFGYSSTQAISNTCYNLLQSRGALGTRVCGQNCSVRDCAAKQIEIPNFDLEVKVHSGRRLWVSVSTLVFENSRNRRSLIVHFAHDITETKKNKELLRKMISVSRQLSNIQDVTLRPAPISPLSEHEKEILRWFSMGKNSAEIARKMKITLQTLLNH